MQNYRGKDENFIQTTPELIIRIKELKPQMNPAQRRISEIVLSHERNLQELGALSIGEFAGLGEVSEATVSRFVKFLGFENYRAFRTEILKGGFLQEKEYKKGQGYDIVHQTDTTKEISVKIFEANIQSLIDTMSIIDAQELEKVADLIVKKRSLIIFAQGRSRVVADSIRFRLYRLGVVCSLYYDSHEQAIVSSLAKEGDLVMSISTFGKSASVINNSKRAKEKGAYVVGVSSYRGTPLEELADCMLISASNEEGKFGEEPSCSTISQMVLLDCLYIIITNRIQDEAKKYFEETYEAISSERGVEINNKPK